MRRLALVAAILAAAPAAAQPQSAICGETEPMLAALRSDKYGEQMVAWHIMPGGQLRTLWVSPHSPRGQSWSVITSTVRGTSCITRAGRGQVPKWINAMLWVQA